MNVKKIYIESFEPRKTRQKQKFVVEKGDSQWYNKKARA